MGYVLLDDILVSKFEGRSTSTLSSPRSKSSPPLVFNSPPPKIVIRLTEIDLMLDSIKDLLLASYFYLEKFKDVSKKTISNVALLRLRMDQLIREATR